MREPDVPEIEISATSARDRRVQSSTIIRIRTSRPSWRDPGGGAVRLTALIALFFFGRTPAAPQLYPQASGVS